MAKIKFGEGITLGLEVPKEIGSNEKMDQGPLTIPTIDTEKLVEEVLSRMPKPAASPDLKPLEDKLEAFRHDLEASNQKVVDKNQKVVVKDNTHSCKNMERLSKKVEEIRISESVSYDKMIVLSAELNRKIDKITKINVILGVALILSLAINFL